MKKTDGKTMLFLRRNAVYIVLALCILAVGLSVTLMLVNRSTGEPTTDVPTINDTIDPPSVDEPVIDPIDPPIDDNPVIEPEDPTPSEPVIKPIEFIIPVANVTAVGEYGDTMVFNDTLGRFTAHLAIDFFAPEGTSVLAAYDGTISSIENTLLEGTTITIEHGNGLYTVYNSLADGDAVSVGQTVKQGDVIGEVSVTNRQEYKSGAHLHFEVIENGENIDPSKYLALQEK